MKKKVLIVTYYWPPAGGPGVQRWLKFVTYLPEHDIEPILYIPENPKYPIIDETLIEEIPLEIPCYKYKIKEPLRWASFLFKKKASQISSGIIPVENSSYLERLLLYIRGNFFIPDARVLWVKPSVRFISKLLNKEQIGTIVTTGPPHSMHLIGLQLKKAHNIKWVADFRDPWTSIGYHDKLRLTQASRNKHKRLEHKVLNEADRIIVTSKATKSEFEKITPRPITVITNGFDISHFSTKKSTLDQEFTISHIGSMLSGRNPENLWKVLSEILQEYPALKKTLRLQFIGVVSKEVLASLEQYQISSYAHIIDYVPHAQAVAYQCSSQVLLLTEINAEITKGIIPGKLFEYMAAHRPILALGPTEWEAGALVLETNSGAYFDYEAHDELKEVVLAWYQQYQKGDLQIKGSTINKYSRKELTKSLAEQLKWE